MADIVSWWLCVIRYTARDLWRALPGPWWAKVLLITVTQAIPGPLDEALLITGTAAYRRWRARQASR